MIFKKFGVKAGASTVSEVMIFKMAYLKFRMDLILVLLVQDADVEGPEPHAYCVVYSTSDRGSLRTAEGWLRSLRNKKPSRARILVGNKVDLVRSRAITTEGMKKKVKLWV